VNSRMAYDRRQMDWLRVVVVAFGVLLLASGGLRLVTGRRTSIRPSVRRSPQMAPRLIRWWGAFGLFAGALTTWIGLSFNPTLLIAWMAVSALGAFGTYFMAQEARKRTYR
jgi:hypothetical protein